MPQCFRLNREKCSRHWNSFSILENISPTMPHYGERCPFRQRHSEAKRVHCKTTVQPFSNQSSISSGSAILFSGGKNWSWAWKKTPVLSLVHCLGRNMCQENTVFVVICFCNIRMAQKINSFWN